MKKIVRSSLYFILVIILEFVVPVIFKNLYVSIGDIRVVLFLNHFLCFIVPAIIFMIATRSNPKDILKINKISLKELGLIVAIAFLSQPIMVSCSVISGLFFTNNVSDFVGRIQGTPFIVMLLLMAVMPAITEEITIRGVVLSGYEKLSDFKAALITGIFFGIFHLDFQQFFYAAVLGVILGYVVRVTNSIFSSMTIHFLINGTSVVMSKILGAFSSTADEVTPIPVLTIPEKVSVIIVYLGIGVLFGFIVYMILKKLKDISSKRLRNA